MALTDPMQFELLRDSIESLLIANQGILFRTIGEQKQSTDAEQVEGNLRTVQIFYSEGDYPKDKSSYNQLTHEVRFQLFYTVANPATANLSVLNDENATAAAKQAALLAVGEGSRLADRSMDELRRIVTQILMDPVNKDLGLAQYSVSDRWLNNFKKSESLPKGNLFVLTGSETLSAMVDETLIGATAIPAITPTVDITSKEEPLSGVVSDENKPKVGVETVQ
jgi:hypothetical protein